MLQIGGVVETVPDVLSQSDRKQQALLADDADLTADRLQTHLPQVHAIDQNTALPHIVEARDQVDQRGLAGARRPDNGDDLAGLDLQVQMSCSTGCSES